MKKGILISSLAFSILAFMNSCNKDIGPNSNDISTVDENDTISYSTQVQPIFDENCINCHNETHSKLDLRSSVSYSELLYTGFSASYVNTTNPDLSNLYMHLTGTLSQMPPSSPLSQTDKDIIYYWIAQGAVSN